MFYTLFTMTIGGDWQRIDYMENTVWMTEKKNVHWVADVNHYTACLP